MNLLYIKKNNNNNASHHDTIIVIIPISHSKGSNNQHNWVVNTDIDLIN